MDSSHNTVKHHHGHLNFLLWPDMQERPSLTTCRCLSFLKEQTSSDIKLQDQISPTSHVIIEEHLMVSVLDKIACKEVSVSKLDDKIPDVHQKQA